jgi:hypothetical protein
MSMTQDGLAPGGWISNYAPNALKKQEPIYADPDLPQGDTILALTLLPIHISDNAVAVAELDSPADEWVPALSADRFTVCFSSGRAASGAKGDLDIWTSRRKTIDDGFPAPTLVGELNTAGADLASWLSADNCRMYGASNGGGGMNHIYLATRP